MSTAAIRAASPTSAATETDAANLAGVTDGRNSDRTLDRIRLAFVRLNELGFALKPDPPAATSTMQSPSIPNSGPPDGLEAARRRWAEEKARGEWAAAERRQAERQRNKNKAPAVEKETATEESDD